MQGRPRITSNSAIGKLIDAYLGEAHELKNLAKDVGVSERQVLAWRKGEDIPNADHCAGLANVLDKPIKSIEDACELDRVTKATRQLPSEKRATNSESYPHSPNEIPEVNGRPDLEILPLPPGIATPNPVMEEVLTIAEQSKSEAAPFAVDGCAVLSNSYKYRGWRKSDILFEIAKTPRQLPVELEQYVAENPLPPEIENHPKLGLTELLPDSSENYKVKMQAAPTSYARTRYVATYLRQITSMPGSNEFEMPLHRHCERLFQYQFEHCELPSILCSQITVVIDNGKKLLLAQRSDHARNHYLRGKWCCSIEEQMSGPPLSDTTKNKPIDHHPFDTIIRGMQEELLGEGYPISRDQVRIL